MRHFHAKEAPVARTFARKVIHLFLKHDDIKREIDAIQTLSRIPHQNIVKVSQYGQLPNSGQYFFDMELCACSLREFINSGGGVRLELFRELLPAERVAYAWKIMEKVAAGLDHIHYQGLVHRDIKPENSKPSSYRSLTCSSLFVKG